MSVVRVLDTAMMLLDGFRAASRDDPRARGLFRLLGYARNTSAAPMPFVFVAIPGFRIIRDPIDYEPRTHHTSLAVGGLLLKDDQKPASMVVASAL